jgi:hypothetical protein
MTELGNTLPPLPTRHSLVLFVDALDALLDDAASANAWTMTPGELREVLPRLTRLGSRLAEVELRVLAQADRQSVGDDVGATNTPAWFAHVTGQTVPAADAQVKLAALDQDRHQTARDALSAGRLTPTQAGVVLDAVDALPAELVDPALRADAEAHLVGLGDLDGRTRFDPRSLRIAGRKVLEVLAPEVAEVHEAAVLEADERHAAATASFTMRPDAHGSMIGRFKIPVLHGEILAKHLDALAAPKHQRAVSGASTGSTTGGEGARVAKPLRWGQAFAEYLETREATGMPRAGGVPATVVVTMTLDNLLDALAGSGRAATLDTGELISAAQARRLACEAGIIPAVLGSKSQPLDLGRKTRFHTETQRIAITLRDGGCAAVGCDWPPGMCHIHHQHPWSNGGKTSVDDGLMLCPRHHTLAHDARYQLKVEASTDRTRGSKVTFTRRT